MSLSEKQRDEERLSKKVEALQERINALTQEKVLQE